MKMVDITPETIISRNDSVISNTLGEDIVMMDIDAGSYYGLESVAARIWELTSEPVSLASICKTLVSEYEVAEPTCEKEVEAFVKDLVDRKIVKIGN